MTGPWPMRSEVDGLAPRVLSALPQTLRSTERTDGALVAIDGERADWDIAVLASLEEGAVGVLVERPRLLSTERLDVLTRTSAPVLLRRPLLDDPLVLEAGARRVAADGALLLTSERRFGADEDPAAALLEQLSVVRRLIAPVARLRAASFHPGGWAVTGDLEGGAAVDLAGVLADGALPSLRAQLLRPPERMSVLLHADATARPAEVRIVDVDGELLLPTSYESAERRAWRRLTAAVSEGRPLCDVDQLRQDLDLLQRVEAMPGRAA